MAELVPKDFVKAAIEEIKAAGYYRTAPAIELQIDDNVISMVSTSTIIPYNGKARITPPKVKPAEGLLLVDQSYLVDGNAVRTPIQLGLTANDRYSVTFERKDTTVKEITDTHYWTSPVTAFTVKFRYGETHLCGLHKLTGRSVGLASRQIDSRCVVYKYPCASFSGQGFTWWVRWTD